MNPLKSCFRDVSGSFSDSAIIEGVYQQVRLHTDFNFYLSMKRRIRKPLYLYLKHIVVSLWGALQ